MHVDRKQGEEKRAALREIDDLKLANVRGGLKAERVQDGTGGS
jgi:hypothetical protein